MIRIHFARATQNVVGGFLGVDGVEAQVSLNRSTRLRPRRLLHKRDIGIDEQLLHGSEASVRRGDADAGADPTLVALVIDRLAERLDETAGHVGMLLDPSPACGDTGRISSPPMRATKSLPRTFEFQRLRRVLEDHVAAA